MNVKGCIEYLVQYHNLKYYVYDQKDKRGLPTAVRFDAELNGEKFYSWGVDKDTNLAYFKALIELIERVTLTNNCSIQFKERGLFKQSTSLKQISDTFRISTNFLHPANSNGVACHLSVHRARESALNELVERHVILSALILKIPPMRFNGSLSLKLPASYDLRAYFWQVQSFFISVSIVRLPKKGFLIGYACSRNLSKSVEKATEEVVSNVIYNEDNKLIPDEEISIIPGNIQSFLNYWKFSGDDRAIKFLESGVNKNEWNRIPKISNVYYSSLIIPSAIKNYSKNLVCIRAISPEAQQLFFDHWNIKYINPNIFKQYDLPDYPHIIA